jgi:hypothetical protein
MKRPLLILAVLVVVLLAFFTEEGYRASSCPVCGADSVKKGIRVLGIGIALARRTPAPCLLKDHRFILSGAAFRFWWKDGTNHFTGIARSGNLLHRQAPGPWLRSRPPADPIRRAVLAALAQATPDQLAELFGAEHALTWRDGSLLTNPVSPELSEAWAEEVLHPWAGRIGPR